jgi:hypothetical protein
LGCLLTVVSTVKSHPLEATVDGYKVGDKLPVEKLEFIDNGEFDIIQHRDKNYIFLFFWSRYFEHYRDTLTMGSRLDNRYKGRNVAFLGVNLDSNWKKVEQSLKRFDIGFPHTYNPYLTFPPKLLGTISQIEGSVVIINPHGEVALLWQLINDEDYTNISSFLDKNLEPIK